jgi:hypothetical protein
LVSYEEAAKRANLDGAWFSSSLLMCMVGSHAYVNVQGACPCSCVWSDRTTIVNNVMVKLSPSLMDKLTFCNNYLYSCGQVIFIFVAKLSLLWCLFCLKIYVCWLCLYVKMEAMRDWVDLSMRTVSKEARIHKPPSPSFTKETRINKPPSCLFTAAVLPLHGSEECY